MKIEVLLGLLFVAVASALVEESNTTENEEKGMCPREFFKKYPEAKKWHRSKNGKRKHFPDFSKMPNCNADGTCPDGLICCSSLCGMKCMKPMFDKDAQKLIEQQDDNNTSEESSESEEDKITEEDKKFGMCPYKYMKTHPEVMKTMKEQFKKYKGFPKHEGCKEGETCPAMHFPNFTKMADCNEEGDCGSGMRCCKTPCGNKCMKGIFTDEDFYSFVNYKGKRSETREVGDEIEEPSRKKDQGKGKKKREGNGNDDENGRGRGVGKNPDNGEEKGKKHGKENREGEEHEKGYCKGKKHNKGQGKGHLDTDGDIELRQKRSYPMEEAHEEYEGQGHGKGNCKGEKNGKDKKKCKEKKGNGNKKCKENKKENGNGRGKNKGQCGGH